MTDFRELVTKLVDVIKQPVFLLAIMLFCAFILYFPPNWLVWLGIADFATTFRPWIGLVFIASGALLLASGVPNFKRWILPKIEAVNQRRRIAMYLENLTADEKTVLQLFIQDRTRTVYLHLSDGVVQGLADQKIILLSSRIGHPIKGNAYNLHPWVWEYLTKKPHLLDGANTEYNPRIAPHVPRW